MASMLGGGGLVTATCRDALLVSRGRGVLRLVGRLAPALLLCGQCGGLLRIDLLPGRGTARATRSGRHPSEVGRPCPVGARQTPSSQVGSRVTWRWPRKGPRILPRTFERPQRGRGASSRARAARYRHPDRRLPGGAGGSPDRSARRSPQTLVVRGTPAEQDALVGQVLAAVTRRGKFIVLDFDRDRIVVNPMLTGRMGLGSARLEAADVRRLDAALWRAGGATCRPRPGRPMQRGCRRTGIADRAPLPRPDAHGQDLPAAGRPDVGRSPAGTNWDPTPTIRRSSSRPGERASSAIGASSRTCFASSRSWPASATATATRSCGRPAWPRFASARRWLPRRSIASTTRRRRPCAWAIDELRRRVPPDFEVEVRDFLHVHRKGGQPCPRCGTTISEIAPGGFVTSFCRGCQR